MEDEPDKPGIFGIMWALSAVGAGENEDPALLL